MSDLISRQAVLSLPRSTTRNFFGEVVEETINVADVRSLPSAQPEQRTGEWKPFDRTWGRSIYHCTACGEAEDCPTEMGRVIWQFCPNCGAKMEVSTKE